MTTSLAHQQQALVSAILMQFASTRVDECLDGLLRAPRSVGLAAYRGNARATADRSLAAAFPVLRQMIGVENFSALAWDFWQRQPPAQGDLSQWGAALPNHVERVPQLADMPYLADLCRLEWAVHRAFFAMDGAVDATSFARLSSQEPCTLSLLLAPGTALVSSPWPVATLFQAHQQQPDLRKAARRLHAGSGEHAMVWRCGHRAVVREITPPTAQILHAALSGATLHALLLLGGAGAQATLGWIKDGVREGWVLGLFPTSHRQ